MSRLRMGFGTEMLEMKCVVGSDQCEYGMFRISNIGDEDVELFVRFVSGCFRMWLEASGLDR